MTPRDDPDSRATSGRAVRRKNQRTRQAARIVSRAGWLDDCLVYWTGSREEVPRLEGAPLPLRAVLQDRLSELAAGLYAVRVGLPESPQGDITGRQESGTAGTSPVPGGPLGLEVSAIEAVTRERIAAAARAIEAAAKFPRAAVRLVGPLPRWRSQALARLEAHRRALEGAEALHAKRPFALLALALEARALWLGSTPPPSAVLSEAALVSTTTQLPETDPAAVRLAAIALGRRHLNPAGNTRLAAWTAAGRALDRWTAAATASAATAVGADALLALASASPCLNDSLAAAWTEERIIDRRPMTIDELRDLARLLAALAAARDEPARRHSTRAGWRRARTTGSPLMRIRRRASHRVSHRAACWIPRGPPPSWPPRTGCAGRVHRTRARRWPSGSRPASR